MWLAILSDQRVLMIALIIHLPGTGTGLLAFARSRRVRERLDLGARVIRLGRRRARRRRFGVLPPPR